MKVYVANQFLNFAGYLFRCLLHHTQRRLVLGAVFVISLAMVIFELSVITAEVR